MPSIRLEYSKKRVRKAGQTLIASAPPAPHEKAEAILILDNWRAAHSSAVDTALRGLKSRLRTIGATGNVSWRLKRRDAILLKLHREPNMQLDTMHDIAGCRAVVDGGVNTVRELTRQWHRTARCRIRREYDYISSPHPTGYRAVHLVVSYGPRIVEIQLRTRAQHAWAVKVEEVSGSIGCDLKHGEGPVEIVDAFLKLSEVLAEAEWAGLAIGRDVLSGLDRILAR